MIKNNSYFLSTLLLAKHSMHNFHEFLQNSREVGANNIHILQTERDMKYLA